jgi:hypothetical protein
VKRFLLGYALYVVCVSVGVTLAGGERSVFDLGFLFGPAIQSVARGDGLADAARMPLVPLFVGGVAALTTSVLAATLAKNLLLSSALARALWDGRADRGWPIAIAYLATFPQLVRHGFALVPEEGWLVPLLGLVFHGLLRASRGARARAAIPFAFANALAFLAKSSVGLLCLAIPILFAWRARSVRVFALFAGVLAIAALAWGAQNLSSTGRFSVMTSIDGYNFWKGNNAHTLEHFPARSLDVLSDLAPVRADGETEWAWDRRCFEEGVRFDLEHPSAALRIAALRFYRVFLAVTPEAPADGEGRGALRFAGVPHMLVFRALLLGGIVLAVRSVARLRDRSAARERALVFLVFSTLFVLPYLMAWSVERRLVPLVVPTVLFALSLFEDHFEPSSFGSTSLQHRNPRW